MRSVSFRFPHQNPVHVHRLPHKCHVVCPSNPPWSDAPDNIQWGTLQRSLSTASCHIHSFSSQYISLRLCRAETSAQFWGPTKHFVTCWFSFCEELLSSHPTQAGGEPLVGCPQLLTRSYRPSPPSPTLGRAMRHICNKTQFTTGRVRLSCSFVCSPMTSSTTARAGELRRCVVIWRRRQRQMEGHWPPNWVTLLDWYAGTLDRHVAAQG